MPVCTERKMRIFRYVTPSVSYMDDQQTAYSIIGVVYVQNMHLLQNSPIINSHFLIRKHLCPSEELVSGVAVQSIQL